MAECLLPLLLLLTGLDLAFVHATGAVDLRLLLPMLVLTAAAPWLRHLQRHFAYRLLWNGGVLIAFALIVQHATTTGLVHMLEDGLALAVLCQVHLLNNVGARQRPDLVFFNSLLVAFVTSLFAPDLTWSLLFVLHALVLVPSLELHAVSRGQSCLTRAAARAVVRGSLPHAVAVVLATAIVFVVWPRDFQRRGWFNDLLEATQQFASGAAERIDLEHENGAPLSDAVVAQLVPPSGRAEDVPSHWRSTAFSTFDGTAWLPQDASELGSRFATDPAWERDRSGAWVRSLAETGLRRVRVRLLDGSQRRLPSPLQARRVELQQAAGLLVDPRSYGGLGLLRLADAPTGALEYTVECSAARVVAAPGARARQHMTALPPSGVPPFVHDLAAQLRRELPAPDDQLSLALAARDWLSEHRRYALPGTPGFAQNLGEFLIGTAPGHCEYFATALALLLRSSGVPCRLVGGYLAHEWSAADRAMLVRGRDAHAWVEAWLPDGEWLTLDATPPADVLADSRPTNSWWGGVVADLELMWATVTGFDAAQRARWLAALVSFPQEHALAVASLLVAAWAVVYLRRRRRTLFVVQQLHRAARNAGMQLRDGETPRELLGRAVLSAATPARLAALRAAALAHERARYMKPGDREP
ncbi:MAG: transglutaminase domain-containing protein [Planctomycetes bacterium]|nr:transglutaminase domain-containing protein [Planctomycetota bacterium]